MKKILALVLALSLLLSAALVSAQAEGEKLYTPGSYYGRAMGTDGPMTVKVTVSEDEIESIVILEYHELLHRKSIVEELLIPEIIKYQTLDVDTVSCATLTSGAVLRSTADALKQAGADMSKLYAPVEKEPAPVYEDGEKFDVIIVGAGVAGMFASMELNKLDPDLKVLVLEKSDFVGGSMTTSGGYIVCLDNEMLRQQGLNFTPEQLADNLQAFSTNQDPDYVVNRPLILNAGKSVDDMWELINQTEAPYDLGRPLQFPGSVAWYSTDLMINEVSITPNAGNEITRHLEPLFYPTCELRLASHATGLITEDGAVKGVTVEDAAQTYSVYADQVILATGGHGTNKEMMEKLNPVYAGNSPLGHADSTGEGLQWVLDLGGYTTGWGICGAMGVDAIPYSFCYPLGVFGGIAGDMVALDGSVIKTREEITAAPEQIAYGLFDTTHQYYSILEDVERAGIGHKFETAEELADAVAQRFEIADRDAFISSINAQIEAKGLKAPYYAVRCAFAFYSSITGAVVNEYCQPLTASGEVIPGLFCVGEIIMGNLYTGAYGQVGSGLGLSGAEGIAAAQYIVNGEVQ